MIGYVLISDSGKFYVGITKNLLRRVREHKSRGPMSSVSFSIKSTFHFPDVNSAATWEIEKIRELGIENTFNTCFGGYGGRKRLCSDAERKFLSERAITRYANPENRKKTAAAVRSAYACPELRKRLAGSVKAACSNPEVKTKRSQSQKASWADPEVRTRRTLALKVANSDPAKAEQRSLAAKKRWENRRARA